MERQVIRKKRTARKGRSGLSEVQSGPSSLTNGDDSHTDPSLLVSTARRIGSVLGKIVVKTENSLSSRKPMSPSQKSAKGKSPQVSENSFSKADSKTQVKGAHSTHSRSTNLKRKPRAQRPASRKARTDQE